MIARRLRRAGVLGINRRNAAYTLRWNPRRLYPLVDDKLETKRRCAAAGIPVPALLAKALHHFELRGMMRELAGQESFVLKPARGAMGNGIVVVVGREGGRWVRAGGRRMRESDLHYHAAGVISGLYALAGQPDAALVEERLEVHPQLADIAPDGVPDVRVIVYRGVPVMAMTRLPTAASGGRANLHQGGVGVGIALGSGSTVAAVCRGAFLETHPDTGRPLIGRAIPRFDEAMEIALRAADACGLGYVGADVVVDERRGAVLLELNARPGLAIQLANRAGLQPRLDAVDRVSPEGRAADARLRLGREIAAAHAGEGSA